jgi:hypothetical protein
VEEALRRHPRRKAKADATLKGSSSLAWIVGVRVLRQRETDGFDDPFEVAVHGGSLPGVALEDSLDPRLL